MSYIKFNALIARRYINRTANLLEKPSKLSRYLTYLNNYSSISLSNSIGLDRKDKLVIKLGSFDCLDCNRN